MSVPASRRNESSCLYLDQAVRAAWLLARMASRLPKRWESDRRRYLVDAGQRLMEECARANAIWVGTVEDSRQRRAHLVEARAQCYVIQALLTQIALEGPTVPKYQRDEQGRKVLGEHGQPVLVGEVPCVSEGRMAEAAAAVDSAAALITNTIKKEALRCDSLSS